VVEGELIESPLIRLPRNAPGTPPVVAEMDRHFMVGSERDEKGEYVDGCENHFLLANSYSALAEQIGAGVRPKVAMVLPKTFKTRLTAALARRKDRSVMG